MTTPTQMPESLKVAAYLVTNLSSGEPSICFEDERGDYGDEDHTPVFEELIKKSDFEAALQSALKARDAEIERLKSVLRQAKPEMRRLLENSLCAADADRPFSDVLAEVKAHPAIKAIEDAISGAPHA